jgi:ADP-ribose pyrophosphatase
MKTISSEEVYRCSIFWVTMDRAIDPDGFEIQRAVVQHPGSAVMMAVDSRRRVLLVKQYRLPAKQYLWELPAGRVDPGETPLKAAKRELKEETGFTARRWSKLVSYYSSPGFLAEKMNIFLAEDLREGDSTPMEDERIDCRWFPLRELEDGIVKGTIRDGKTLAALAAYRLSKRGKVRRNRGPAT